jgi:transcriptional regulator with XRE-family HTH domain
MKNQPILRLVVSKDDDCRRKAQSTSGRVVSQRTIPPDSRSNAMARDSPNFCFVDRAFRMYPIVVPHRAAKSDWAPGLSELTYSRSSIQPILPSSKVESIPVGNLPAGNERYHRVMSDDPLDPTRTANFLRLLREDYGNSPKKFEVATGYSANMVSQIKTGKKWVGYDLARRLEGMMRKPRGLLDQMSELEARAASRNKSGMEWPFSVSLEDIQSLSGRKFKQIDELLTDIVVGARAQQTIDKQKRGNSG